MKFVLSASATALALFALACAPKKPSPPPTESFGTGGTLRAVLTSAADFDPGPGRDAVIGAAAPSTIASLQLAFQQISMCQDVVLDPNTGKFTGFSECIDFLPNEPTAASPADRAKQLADARGSNAGFIDLASKTSRATLDAALEINGEIAGTYRYGFVKWRYPVKAQATLEVMIPGPTGHSTQVWRTRAGTTALAACPEGKCPAPQTQVTGSFADGAPAEETTYGDPIGAAVFAFFAPVKINEEMINSQTDYTLDLVFDLDGVLRGRAATSCSAKDPLVDSGPHDLSGTGSLAPCNVIEAPNVTFVGIVHPKDERLRREYYRGTVAGSGYDPLGVVTDARCGGEFPLPPACKQNFDLGLALYSLRSDAQRRVLGAELKVLMSRNDDNPSVENTTGIGLPRSPVLGNAVSLGDGTLELQNEGRSRIVSGFTRPAALTPGATVDAWLECGVGRLSFAGCGAADRRVSPPVLYDDPISNPPKKPVQFTLE
ncbi:MAG: hypothetical protein IT381_12120 [Deltaproteobacteria bacterium]|nr:hypothetical protein [Deltaproteobacteria bacterium]